MRDRPARAEVLHDPSVDQRGRLVLAAVDGGRHRHRHRLHRPSYPPPPPPPGRCRTRCTSSHRRGTTRTRARSSTRRRPAYSFAAAVVGDDHQHQAPQQRRCKQRRPSATAGSRLGWRHGRCSGVAHEPTVRIAGAAVVSTTGRAGRSRTGRELDAAHPAGGGEGGRAVGDAEAAAEVDDDVDLPGDGVGVGRVEVLGGVERGRADHDVAAHQGRALAVDDRLRAGAGREVEGAGRVDVGDARGRCRPAGRCENVSSVALDHGVAGVGVGGVRDVARPPDQRAAAADGVGAILEPAERQFVHRHREVVPPLDDVLLGVVPVEDDGRRRVDELAPRRRELVHRDRGRQVHGHVERLGVVEELVADAVGVADVVAGLDPVHREVLVGRAGRLERGVEGDRRRRQPGAQHAVRRARGRRRSAG